MPAIEPKGDFLLFRETLTELERLVDVRDNLYCADHAQKAIAEGIIYTLDLLTEYNVNTSESNSIEELERLVEMDLKVTEQNRRAAHLITELHKVRFDKMIDSKIDFIKIILSVDSLVKAASNQWLRWSVSQQYNGRSVHIAWTVFWNSRYVKLYGEPEQRQVPDMISSSGDTLLMHSSAPHHPPWPLVPKPRQSPSMQASQKQENPKRDLPNECEESKTTAKFVSCPLSWLQDHDNVLAEDDDSSTIDGGEFTPTSTVVSELPDFTSR